MLTGLIGYPIEKTPSPAMHNAAYKYLGIDGRYVRLAVKRNALKSAIKDLIRSGFQGVNITIPYKQAVLEYLDSMSKTAIKINAVNTIMIKNGRLIGENTDVDGFQRSLAYHHVKIRDKRILLIGTGGAGRAVGLVIGKLRPASLLITDIVNKQARDFADHIKAEVIRFDRARSLKDRCDMIINAAPVDHQALATVILGSGGLYYDINYTFPRQFIGRMRVINGLEMLVQQGARSFEIWTGKRAPVLVMRKAVMANV
ncbi:shikimate dehydrogenase [candidate division WOR-3 bacterium RBG_13_43_14]|uniref:shikimate dehydrogenase (NADP(+)) n=1 Tax=candidate division WOR-3 bacterium RBG_13_43_14 TaxID=1802590 RepID=A0A1F4U8I5_UNCW3|nr:MAG: shikimate dehydrogenase [candidate division WOR-3 bacterium RBG_13_43_14]